MNEHPFSTSMLITWMREESRQRADSYGNLNELDGNCKINIDIVFEPDVRDDDILHRGLTKRLTSILLK